MDRHEVPLVKSAALLGWHKAPNLPPWALRQWSLMGECRNYHIVWLFPVVLPPITPPQPHGPQNKCLNVMFQLIKLKAVLFFLKETHLKFGLLNWTFDFMGLGDGWKANVHALLAANLDSVSDATWFSNQVFEPGVILKYCRVCP